MTKADLTRILFVFAALEFVLGAVLLFRFDNLAIGASQVAIGMSLVVVAITTGKKKSNG